MTWEPVAPLVFVWWNTSLSPPTVKPKATADDLAFVVSRIKQMRAEFRFAVFGLGEVPTEDLDAILTGVGDSSLSVFDATDRSDKLKFDTAIIYDRAQLELNVIEPSYLEERYGRTTLKLGTMARFVTIDTHDVVHVVVSHWLSRRTAGEFAGKRAELGTLLRQRLQKLRIGGENPYIVLMGDYNDDPFSPSLAEHLLATRDRELAKCNPAFLYNPFWRCLGESLPAAIWGTDVSVCGTHFYPNGEYTQWFTYDQIIFSSAFLNDGSIVLNEEYTRIVSTPELTMALHNGAQTCDHFPVLSIVTLRSPQ